MSEQFPCFLLPCVHLNKEGGKKYVNVIHAVQACRCIDALVTMGVLVPGGDRTAVRRTAEFFLKNFEVN